MNHRTQIWRWLSLFLTARALLAADQFYLREQKVKAPEMGEILCYVLVSGTLEYSLRPPADWRMRVEPASHCVTFDSPDHTADIRLLLAGPNPALREKADPALLRKQVEQRFAEAKIIEEFPCYTSSYAGRAFDLEWTAAGSVPMASRVACFPTPNGSLEFTLTTMASKFRNCRPALARLMTSFQPTSTPGRPRQ